jgi:hypothetical protein
LNSIALRHALRFVRVKQGLQQVRTIKIPQGDTVCGSNIIVIFT